MLSSITPLGERARGRRWGRTATAYALGSVGGGAAMGVLAGSVGALLLGGPPTYTSLTAASVAFLCALGAGLEVRRLPLPTIGRQVNEDWLGRYRGWVVGAGLGLQLGLGVVTIVTTATLYLTVAFAVLTASPPAGLAIGATFGIARALPIVAVAAVTTPGRLAGMHRRLDALATPARYAAAGSLCLLTVLALEGTR